jgi:hypothetical protein
MSVLLDAATPGARVLGQAYEYAIGVDLGQKQDHTAVAVLEKVRTQFYERDPYTADFLTTTECRVVKVERLPLGTAYPEIVERVRTLALSASASGQRVPVVVDATGVGGVVVDLLRARRLPGQMVPVTITGGDKVTPDGAGYRVPKRDLIVGLQVAFETRQLAMDPRLRGLDVLVSELMSMRVAVSASGHERFEAWREGSHDDLVLAVALAWWQMARRDPGLRKCRGW